MLKIVTFLSFSMFFAPLFSQQIGNSDLEQWENVAAPTEEPVNWNSFKTGSGTFAGFASKQVERNSMVRAGASGMYCARIWSVSTLGITANGNMTLGQINLGSATPANAANYNYSKTSDPNFSEVLTTSPDSIVFWVKYTQAGGGNQEARMKALIHDAFDARDPEDATTAPHVVARAELNYSQTGGAWVRKSVPFVYSGPATTPAFILVTFATNATPGGGAANDEVLIDDVSLIYNSGANLNENQLSDLRANYSDISGIHFFSNEAINGNLLVFNSLGVQEFKGEMTEYTKVKLSSGVHFAKYQLVSGKSGTIKFLVD
jgi:hypothetical protein